MTTVESPSSNATYFALLSGSRMGGVNGSPVFASQITSVAILLNGI
jgi:hypothetical protein